MLCSYCDRKRSRGRYHHPFQDIWDRIYRTHSNGLIPLVSCPSMRYGRGKQQEQESMGLQRAG